MLEGDALQVVMGLWQSKEDWSQGGCLIQDARTIMNTFDVWSINRVCREANTAAHKLAKDALNLVENVYDLENVP